MMQRSYSMATVVTLFACLLLSSAAVGQNNKKLSEGDTAPGLDVEKWVKGDAVTFQNDRVYVVVFVEANTTMAERVRTFGGKVRGSFVLPRDVTMVWISKQDPDVVARWARVLGDDLTGSVAADRRSGTWRKWMDGSGNGDSPLTIFIVDRKGKIQFIGNPLVSTEQIEYFGSIVTLVRDGRYDARLFRQTAPLRRAIETSRRVKNWRMCNKHIDELLEVDGRVFAGHHLIRFEMMLVDQGDREAAYAYAKQLTIDNADDPTLLANLAAKIARDPAIPDDKRDFAVAKEVAKAAAQATDPSDPLKYHTEAMVYYHAGEFPKAVALQRQAWRVAAPYEKERMKHDLEIYTRAMRDERKSKVE